MNEKLKSKPSGNPAPGRDDLPQVDIDELREHVNKLKGLLDNPHPGLSTWQEAYSERMHAISGFWSRETYHEA